MEEHKLSFDIRRMFPESVRRAEILDELRHNWPAIVRHLARDSEPYCLGVNELCIYVKNDKAEYILSNMKGSILRAMTNRFGYVSDGEFTLKFNRARQPEQHRTFRR